MPRQRNFVVNGVEVTRADIRRWMASVGSRCPTLYYWGYVRDYQVVAKIARFKADGTLEQLIAEAARGARVSVRAARTESTIHRLRRQWPEAANDQALKPRLIRT